MNDGGTENNNIFERQKNVSFQILNFLFLLRVTFYTMFIIAYYYASKTFFNSETVNQFVKIQDSGTFNMFLIFFILGSTAFAVYKYLNSIITAFNEMKASKDFTEKFLKEKLNG